MIMVQLLEQYFIEFEVLDLPQLGTLRKIKKEANFLDGIWSTPKEFIVFDNYQNKPSAHFYTFLAQHLDISEQSASTQLDLLINDFLNNTEVELIIGSLGMFKHQNSIIEWVSTYNSELYYDTIDLPILAPTNSEEEIQQDLNNKWWLGALTLLILAIVLILFKFS